MTRRAAGAADLREENNRLRERLRLLEDALETMSHGLCMFDPEGRIAVSNRRYAEVIGQPPEKIRPGMSMRELTQLSIDAGYYGPEASADEIAASHWADVAAAPADRRRLERGGRSFAVENGVTAEGFVVATFKDVTEKLAAEGALRESEARLRAMFDALPDCVIIFDESHRITYVNPRGLELVEAPDLETFLASGPPMSAEDHAKALDVHSRVMDGETVVWTHELFGMNGARHHVEVHSVPFRTPDGMIAHLCISRDISERKRAEDALRRNAKRLRLVQEATGLADFEAGADRIARCSRRLLRQLGLPEDGPADLAVDDWLHLIHPEDRNHFLAMERNLAKRDRSRLEFRIVRADTGEVRWISSNVSMERDENGKVIGAIGAHLDITDRKRAEETVRESEARMRAMLDAMPDCVKIFDEKATLTYINPRGLELLEAPDLPTLLGSGHAPVRPEYLDECVDVHNRVIAGEKVVWTYEIVGMRGATHHVEAHSVPFRMPDGTPAHMCISRDIGERKQAEDALRRSEQRLRLVQEATSLADFETGADGMMVGSKRFFEQLGLPPADGPVEGKAWAKHVHPEDIGWLVESLEATIASGSEHFHGEFRIVRADTGETRWLCSDALMERAEDGTVSRTIGAHFDVTERKRAEEALRQGEEVLRLAHRATGMAEFETGPGGIIAYSDRFYEQVGLPPREGPITLAEWMECVHPEDRQRFREETNHQVRPDTTITSEFRIVRADTGEVRWLQTHSTVERDGTSGSFRSIGAHLDITDRKRAEQELRASEERLRLVQEATGLAEFETDEHGIVSHCERFYEQIGLPPRNEPITLAEWLEHVHPDDRERFRADVLRGPGADLLVSEFRIVRADTGEVRWLQTHNTIERDAAGAYVRSIGAHLDITERKRAEQELRASEERLRLVQEATGLGDFESTGGELAYISERFREQVGLPPGTTELPLERWLELLHPDDRDRQAREALESRKMGDGFESEFRIVRADTGEVRWISGHVNHQRDAAGNIVRTIGAHLDITERKRAEEALRESEERFRLAAEAAGLGVWDYDPELDQREWSGRLREIFGISHDAPALRDTAVQCVRPEDRGQFMQHLEDMNSSRVERFETSLRINRADDGRERWLAFTGWRTRKAESGSPRIILTVRDVTEEKTAEERIRWSASHDPLTRLANRALFQEKLSEAIAGAKRRNEAVGVVLLDLDHFKQINDSLGHDVGDALLKLFAERLRGVVRRRDTVARLGGDEFAIVVPHLRCKDDLIGLSHSIQERMRAPFVHGGRVLDCRVSSGASIFPDHGGSLEEVLKNADTALYAAKAAGRAMVTLYEPHMREDLQRRVTMVQLGRKALDDDQVIPYYQPKLDLQTGNVEGFEALLRWRNAKGRICHPAALEAAFEDLEVAAAISDRMIDRTIADMRGWLDRGVAFRHVAVNASAAEFRRDNFAERLLDRLHRADVPTRCFQLEVTETVFLGRGAEYVHRALALLNTQGVKIALDDFGTGYASLRHLKQFPVDIIKIDQSFVRDMEVDPNDEAIVRAVINLGQSLNIHVVAEGIERLAQAERLQRLGCDYGQGYLFSKAVPASRVPPLVGRWRGGHTARLPGPGSGGLRLVSSRS